MKQILFICIAGMLTFFSASCYDDKGSYDYHEINEITVSNWPEDGYTAINNSDTLRITPQWELDSTSTEPYIAFSMDNGQDTARYEYIWEVQESEVTSDDQGTIISRERNLVYPVNLPPTNYYVFLKIRDTNDLFIPVKQEGQIGIPCIVREDRSVTLDWGSVL